MSLSAMVKRQYNALINSGLIATAVLPTDAAAKTLTCKNVGWTWPANYEQIAATVGAVDVWVYGVLLQNPLGLVDYQVQLGIGAAPPEVLLADGFTMNAADVTLIKHEIPLPILVAAATRLVGMAENAAAVANTIDVRVLIITGA